jgi:hypothetical protein
MGVFPGPFLRPMEPSIAKVLERVTGPQPTVARALPATEGGASAPDARVATADKRAASNE